MSDKKEWRVSQVFCSACGQNMNLTRMAEIISEQYEAEKQRAELYEQKHAALVTYANEADARADRLEKTRHNHITRDVKPMGQCLACDVQHLKQENQKLKEALEEIAEMTAFAHWHAHEMQDIAKDALKGDAERKT